MTEWKRHPVPQTESVKERSPWLLPLDGAKPGQRCSPCSGRWGWGLSVHEMGELSGFVVQLVVGHELVQLTLSAAWVVVVGAKAGVAGDF